MYECPNCGGNLKFDIPSQQMACSFCGTKKSPYEVKKETDAIEKDYFEATVFTCPQCAGELLSADNEATSFCSFCGASTILSSRISKEKRPQYIIPFKKTKEDCKAAYAKKMRKAFFVPDELKEAKYIDGFRGIYMPYWTYQFTQNKNVDLKGEKSHREGDYIITDHYNIRGDLDAYYLGYARDASSSFYDNISEALAPYDAKELVNFEPSFLSGFYADTADVGSDIYLPETKALADDSSYDKICKTPAFQGYTMKNSENRKHMSARLGTVCRSVDSTMYPVWFLSYRNKDRVAYATVNGQTGKVVADMPIDPKKYVLSSLILAVILFAVLNLFFTFKPTTLLAIGSILVIVSAIVYAVELNSIWRKETNADDRGMQEAERKKTEEYRVEEWMAQAGDNGKKAGKVIRKQKANKKEKKSFSEWLIKNWFSLMVIIFIVGPAIGVRVAEASFLAWLLIFGVTIACCVIGMKNNNKIENMKKTPGFVLSMATVFLALIIKLLNPVSDLWYYAGTLILLVAVLFNMIDVIRNYNRLAMRRLPQFDKKGGDDLA